MPRYVVSLAVGGQQYITDEHGIELDTLYDVHTKALRILEQTFPFAPDHLSWALAVLGKRQSCVRMHEAGPVSF